MSSGGFEFFISQKTEVAVVTMVGCLNKANSEQIEECARIVEGLAATFIIFNMRDINEVKEQFVRPFAKMQMAARKRGQMRISGLRPEFSDFLAQRGLIRQLEMANNLNDAISDFMKKFRRVA